jgi:hypothetical protein
VVKTLNVMMKECQSSAIKHGQEQCTHAVGGRTAGVSPQAVPVGGETGPLPVFLTTWYHCSADTTMGKCGLRRSVYLRALVMLLWTQQYVCCGWSELSFKSQRDLKFDDKDLKAGAPYSRSKFSVPISTGHQTISLLQSDLLLTSQLRKKKDDILGRDDETDDTASASSDSSDSYGIYVITEN